MVEGKTFKFQFKPLTLDDKVIKDGVEAVGTLTGKEPYYVVGGIGVQSYLPTSCRRPTSDIDICVVKPLSYSDFREFVRPIVEYLMDNHYNVRERKHARAFKLETNSRDAPEEKLLIEFSRRNQQNFERNKLRLERELANSKSKILEERHATYLVASPEDIVVPKLVRVVNSRTRHPEFKKHIPSRRAALSEESIKEALTFIADMRESAILSPGHLILAEELRFVSDIYDIRILSEIAGLNPSYFKSVCPEWEALSEKKNETNSLLKIILPEGFEVE